MHVPHFARRSLAVLALTGAGGRLRQGLHRARRPVRSGGHLVRRRRDGGLVRVAGHDRVRLRGRVHQRGAGRVAGRGGGEGGADPGPRRWRTSGRAALRGRRREGLRPSGRPDRSLALHRGDPGRAPRRHLRLQRRHRPVRDVRADRRPRQRGAVPGVRRQRHHRRAGRAAGRGGLRRHRDHRDRQLRHGADHAGLRRRDLPRLRGGRHRQRQRDHRHRQRVRHQRRRPGQLRPRHPARLRHGDAGLHPDGADPGRVPDRLRGHGQQDHRDHHAPGAGAARHRDHFRHPGQHRGELRRSR